MYVIVRNKEKHDGLGAYSLDSPEYRKSYMETMERVKNMDPRQLSPERRLMIKAMRFQGKTPKLVGKCAAIRRAMEMEINS